MSYNVNFRFLSSYTKNVYNNINYDPCYKLEV